MSYNNIETFLEESKRNKKNPMEYNFEFECGDSYKDFKEKSSLERYLDYKSTGINLTPYYNAGIFCLKNQMNYPRLLDCDGTLDGRDVVGEQGDTCALTRSLYRTLWGWQDGVADSELVKRYGTIDSVFVGEFGPETMNSVQTILNEILKEVVANNKEFAKIKQGHYSVMLFLELYCRFNDVFISEIESKKGVKNYLDAYHTLGNFVLVPKGFNPYRGLEFGDYWDISMFCLSDTEGDKEWLDTFEFKKYVNYFFLWDYVNSKYEIKSLQSNSKIFKNESAMTISGYNQKTVDITNFLANCTWAIKRRGIFMTAMLRIVCEFGDDGKTFYKKLQDEIFMKSICYNGYQKVFEEIKMIKGYENFRSIIEEAYENINNVIIDEE